MNIKWNIIFAIIDIEFYEISMNWFEFMKMQDGAAILRGAAAVAGGRAKK